MLSFVRQLPARDGGIRSSFKASALASASASWDVGVPREFACSEVSKAALCAWPQVTGTDCVGALKEMISRVLDFLPKIRFPRIRAGEEERQRKMPFAQSRPGIRPSGGFIASLGF